MPDPVTPDPLAELAAAVAPFAAYVQNVPDWPDNDLPQLDVYRNGVWAKAPRLADLRRLVAAAEAVRGRVDEYQCRAVAAERNLGNILARIFGDGGHRQTAIGDDARAAAEADAAIVALRGRVEGLEKAVEGLLDGLDANGDPERCGLSQQQWDRRVAAARAALGGR